MNWPTFLSAYLSGLYVMLAFAMLGWLLSLARNNVTHVDSMWSLFFALAACTYALQTDGLSTRAFITLALVTIWALRLCVYLTWRNWGPHEDHRYVQIRQNNAPYFAFKSIYIVFGLQAVLAWLISLPIFASISLPSVFGQTSLSHSTNALNMIDFAGIALVCFGLIWESLADWQLSTFKANVLNNEKVLNSGVWRYSRHPNYFGECCVWWGFYLIALAAGHWWAIPSALLMTFMLLKVSGVALLEKDITHRRPDYVHYIQSTNAMIPGPKKVSK